MAIINSKYLGFLTTLLECSLSNKTAAFYYDRIMLLAEHCIDNTKIEAVNLLIHETFSDAEIIKAKKAFNDFGIIGIFASQFEKGITNHSINSCIERKIVALKKGFPHLPATKASTVLKGFGLNLKADDILSVYASYGFAQGMKKLAENYDFKDINRRVSHLARLTKQSLDSVETKIIHKRYLAMRAYLKAEKGEREKAIQSGNLTRSLFFYYWKSFNTYGLLGLIDRGKETFRESKMGLANEAKIVIDKLQNPEQQGIYYVKQLRTKGVTIDPSSVSKIFSRWEISKYKSAFVSNLKRLEKDFDFTEKEEVEVKKKEMPPQRYVDNNFVLLLEGIRKGGMYVDAPGIFVIWVYLEELGIYPVLDRMGLTYSENGKGYNWFDHFLLNVARIFYGIPSYSRTCDHEEPSLSLFSHLVSLPCNDSFLNGLGRITEDQVFELQRWMVNRCKELGIIQGKRIAFDFKQIDLNVELGKLRDFGKGPSPRKKICCNGFRPHIVWDLDTGNLIALEFRKGSARGTTTVKRFVKDFILSPFKGIFEEVYVDSEYTGKDVWNFVLDSKEGMGAAITACIKQNAFVKKGRDKFLFENSNDEDFWIYYDENHVYSAKTFLLSWEYQCRKSGKKKKLKLFCVVKKHIKNGSLRCFGSSKKDRTSKQILEDYSYRWIIEIGIKDLNQSYYLSNVPGTKPHHVNVHFFIVSVCRHLHRMLQRDLGDFIKRHDGSIKTLQTMRETLFRQGSARLCLKGDTLEVSFLNSYSAKLTEQLNHFYKIISDRNSKGLLIIGGMNVKFKLNTPLGIEYRNGMKKVPLISGEKFLGAGKTD